MHTKIIRSYQAIICFKPGPETELKSSRLAAFMSQAESLIDGLADAENMLVVDLPRADNMISVMMMPRETASEGAILGEVEQLLAKLSELGVEEAQASVFPVLNVYIVPDEEEVQ